jgi:N-acetylneuraminic acid mutarotase
MSFMRVWHTATLLPNGKVLVAGGSEGNFANTSAELYDFATGHWTATSSMTTNRSYHTAALLGNGTVLVTGGQASSAWYSGPLDAAELYDPAAGTWTITGHMANSRYAHTATVLADGRVLVTGGVTVAGETASCEIYDPVTGSWSQTGSLGAARYQHTATLLLNGKVLVVGGSIGIPLASAEIYDPVAGTWAPTASLVTSRYAHTATLLPGGKVLIAAGEGASGRLASAAIYDPTNGMWTATGSLLNARRFHSATLMPDSNVFVAGSYSGGTAPFADAESYNPVTGQWSAEGNLVVDRYQHTATRLPNGTVLIAGGYAGSIQNNAELYVPTTVYHPMQLQSTMVNTGVLELSFTNSPGGWFEVIASTNLSLPLANWTSIGGPALEVSPGSYQFMVTNMAGVHRQFYWVRSL